MKVVKLAAGLAVGYVLGSRAGREKYEQIVATARKVAGQPAPAPAPVSSAPVSSAPVSSAPVSSAPVSVTPEPEVVTPATAIPKANRRKPVPTAPAAPLS